MKIMTVTRKLKNAWFIIFTITQTMAFNRPYIELNTRDSWFSQQLKRITWNIHETTTCTLPLNTTLSLVDCGNNGQIVKSVSTKENSISIDSADFNRSTLFYALSAMDSDDNSCGTLSYLFRINEHVQTETQFIFEGNDFCINTLLFGFNYGSPIYAFWPTDNGSTTNCFCPILQSNALMFSDCYCINLQLTAYTVIYNVTTAKLCWKNLDLTMNGSVVGIASEENANCGYQTHSSARNYIKMIYIIVKKNNDYFSSQELSIVSSIIRSSSPNNLDTRLSTQNTVTVTMVTSALLTSTTSTFQIKENSSSLPPPFKDTNATVLISATRYYTCAAGISSLVIIFVLATFSIIILVAVLIHVQKAKEKRNVTNDHEPVYDSPTVTTEPLYEDITIVPTTTDTVVSTQLNEAYTVRKFMITKHATINNIEMENNEAYAVGKLAEF